MKKLNIVKNVTFKRQFMISVVLVLILSFLFTIGGFVLDIWLIGKGVILRADYYSSQFPKIEEFINKNKNKIIDKDFKKELEKVIPTAGIEYEVVDSQGQLSYGYFKKPIESKISISKEAITKVDGWVGPRVIKYVPIVDNDKLKGMVILKYYIRESTKDPKYNILVAYSDIYFYLSPFLYIILFSILFAGSFNKRLNVPLKELMEASERIRVRDLEFNISYQSNNELGMLCKSFESMRKDLQESLEKQWKMEEERKEMVGAVAHDLKTPITIIKGHVEGLLESKKLDADKLHRYLNLINKNTDRMSKLVEKINLLTKIENPDFKLNNKDIDLVAYINEKSLDYSTLAENKNLKFICNIKDNRSSNDLINIDTYSLSEILDNLVSNSIRFTPEEGSIALNLELNLDEIIFSVSDTGCGFSDKDLENVFKKFYQGDESRSKEKGHAGLGLHIVKVIVDKLNGSIEVRNNVYAGCEVRIRVPMDYCI